MQFPKENIGKWGGRGAIDKELAIDVGDTMVGFGAKESHVLPKSQSSSGEVRARVQMLWEWLMNAVICEETCSEEAEVVSMDRSSHFQWIKQSM